MGRTWVDVPSDFRTEVGLTGRNKDRAEGSSSTSCKSGVSVIIASSSSESCNKEHFTVIHVNSFHKVFFLIQFITEFSKTTTVQLH